MVAGILDIDNAGLSVNMPAFRPLPIHGYARGIDIDIESDTDDDSLDPTLSKSADQQLIWR